MLDQRFLGKQGRFPSSIFWAHHISQNGKHWQLMPNSQRQKIQIVGIQDNAEPPRGKQSRFDSLHL